MKKILLLVLISFSCLIMLLSCSTTEKPKEEIKVEEVILSSNKTVIKLIRNPSRGYNYDGYIYIPPLTTQYKTIHLLVIPYNGSKGTLSFQDQQARRYIVENSWQVKIAEGVRCPLFMPVFPKDENSENFHELTYEAITSTGKNRRIDLQLINMIKDVLEYLSDRYDLSEKILMAGASASGDFVSRFAVLHPEIVQAVVTSLNAGIPMSPAKRIGSTPLEYPFGVFNFRNITGQSFNLEAFQQVNILSMNGNLDEDSTHYLDGRSNIYPMTKEQLLRIYGDTIIQRCETTFEIFSKYTERFQSLLYDNVGHQLIVKDAITFLNKNKDGEFIPITPSEPVVFNKNTANIASNSNQ
ncbi:MAG: hypothetical protein ACI4SL_02050 [Candidatus Ornithospirochaeta sp.]